MPGRQHDDEYESFLPLFRQFADPATPPAERDRIRQALVTGHLPLAEHIAHRYRDRGQPIDDLRQVARVGLINAIDRFDPERGDFVVFAIPTIMGEVRRYFRDFAWTMSVPRTLKELNRKIAVAVNDLVSQYGTTPRPTQIADYLKLPVEEIYQGLQAGMAYHPDSLDLPQPRSSESAEPAQLDAEFGQVENRETLGEAMTRLPSREADIVRLRFFEELTQRQIAQRMGISQVHVSRLLAHGLAILRKSLVDAESA